MKNIHLSHVEDLIFDGHFIQAFDILSAVVDSLYGHGIDRHLHITTKYDGAPAVVFGVDPSNNKTFVGTKSVFNKRIQKIAYNHDDVDYHYGDKPELACKLKMVAGNVDNFEPGVYQGDLMWYPGEISVNDTHVSFTPNTITYSIKKSHPIAAEIMSRKVGLVVHTRYEGDSVANSHATMCPTGFNDENSNAFFIDSQINTQHHQLSDQEHTDLQYMIYALEAIERDPPENLQAHSPWLKKFMNHCVRMGESCGGLDMYVRYLENRGETFLAEHAKTPALVSIFSAHEMMTIVKKILLDALNRNQLFECSVNGRPIKHEGFVVSYHGVMVKLVDRLEFSRLNFMNRRFEVAK